MTTREATRVSRANLTQVFQEQQQAIRRQALVEFLGLWPSWSIEDLDGTWEPFRIGLLAVIERYHTLASTNAGRYYRTLRMVQGVPGEVPIVPAEFDRAKVDAHLTLLGPIFTKKGIASRRPNPMDKALVRLSGVVTAGVLDGGRETLLRTGQADPKSRGWRRVTTGTCSWCAQLAAWGAFHRNGEGWQGHSNCRCGAEPQWVGQEDTPAIDVESLEPPELIPEGTEGWQMKHVAQERVDALTKDYARYTDEVLNTYTPGTRDIEKARALRVNSELGGRLDVAFPQAQLEDTLNVFRSFGTPNVGTAGERLTASFTNHWAGTSGDANVKALTLQRAAAEYHGLPWPPKGYIQALDESTAYGKEALTAIREAEALYAQHGAVLDVFIEDMYQFTQQTLAEMFPGQDRLLLWRGLDDAKGITGLVEDAGVKHGVASFNPLTSFSLNPSQAAEFGNVTIAVEVPMSRVIGSPFSGFGTFFEDEFVLLAGPADDAVAWAKY